ncbi:MAG: multiheme c-type cytochrome [Bryobacterales bacterium]|nr:multiheme c-type cytochrome [Bryobacterales bacterium]
MSSRRFGRIASIAGMAAILLAVGIRFPLGWDGHADAAETLLRRQGFAGSAACAKCHPAIHASYSETSMRAALLEPGRPRALRGKLPISNTVGRARYAIREAAPGRFRYGVQFGEERLNLPVRWVFGLGAAGQTYVLEDGAKLLESRVSFYDSTRELDLTIGAANEEPGNLREAAGRLMSEADIRECFGCHALGVPPTGEPTLDGIEPGVGCENCHGPAAAHVAARSGGDLKAGRMTSLRGREAEEISQLCGQCHRTWEDVMSLRIRGVNNVRFQPYRLTLSPCYDSADMRISCVACHNPHANVVRGAAAYDAKCMGCHSTAAAEPRPKAVRCGAGEQTNCATCHMPKRALPGAHHEFSDHYIRVHRAGEAYPDL